MKKVILNNDFFNKAKLIYESDISFLYLLSNKEIFKGFNPVYLLRFKSLGMDIEKKVFESENIIVSPNVLLPNSAVYTNTNTFIGYTMPKANGITFNEHEITLTRADKENLYRYAEIHYNLEKTVKDSPSIVFPDLLSCDNIMIDKNNNIQIIDYDGHQIKNIGTPIISTNLGNQTQYLASKKYYQNKLFTKQLDIKSLIVLYFLDTFNIDLNKVGMIDPNTGTQVTIDEVFYRLNLFDNDFNHKVWKIFNENSKNEYLGEDMFRIADKYSMQTIGYNPKKDVYTKKLRKK